MTQCTACGDADALLFACSHCDREFCADHQFPHHACDAFAAARAASGRDDDPTPGTGWAATAGADASSEHAAPPEPSGGSARGSDAAAGGGAVAAEPASTAGASDGPGSTDDGGSGTPAAASGATDDDAVGVTSIARDAARERRPDRQGPPPTPKGRGLPAERRDDRTVVDWMREQSYPGYLAKVGSLSLLFTTSYYAGLAAVL